MLVYKGSTPQEFERKESRTRKEERKGMTGENLHNSPRTRFGEGREGGGRGGREWWERRASLTRCVRKQMRRAA